jgi:hypothetical protein
VVGAYKTVYGCQGKHGMRNLILAVLILPVPAFSQSPAPNPINADSPFQVRYAANLNIGESYIDITNTGANRAGLPAPGPGGPFYAGNICVKPPVPGGNQSLASKNFLKIKLDGLTQKTPLLQRSRLVLPAKMVATQFAHRARYLGPDA